MRYYCLSSQEKVVARLLEDDQYRRDYIDLLRDEIFDNTKLTKIVSCITIDRPMTSIAFNLGRSYVSYAMELCNAYAETTLSKTAPLPIQAIDIKSTIINTPSPFEKKYTESASFNRVLEGFSNLIIKKKINHEEYVCIYNDWQSYFNSEEKNINENN